jgi:hypothetical protein
MRRDAMEEFDPAGEISLETSAFPCTRAAIIDEYLDGLARA